MTIDGPMLASMREAIAELLPDRCDILEVTLTPDGMGGQTETWSAAYSNIPFRLDMESGIETLAGGAQQPFTRYKGSLPYDTVVTSQNRIRHNGTDYAVTGGPNAGQSWKAVVRVDLEKV